MYQLIVADYGVVAIIRNSNNFCCMHILCRAQLDDAGTQCDIRNGKHRFKHHEKGSVAIQLAFRIAQNEH